MYWNTTRIRLMFAKVFIIATCLTGCNMNIDSAKSTSQVEVLGWGRNNILSPSLEVNPPQSFLVVKVRIPFALVDTSRTDGEFECQLSTEDFTLLRTKSSLGDREFAAEGAKSGSDGYRQGKVVHHQQFSKMPEAIEWIIFFPLSSLDVSTPNYTLRFRDKPPVRISAKPMVDVKSLSDPQVIYPAKAKP